MPSTPKIAMELGGTFVAGYGIGRKFRAAGGRYKSAVERDLTRGLEHLLDPAGVVNPGRTLPP